MAGLTPQTAYLEILTVCDASSLVSGYTLRMLDLDVLSMRVHLEDESFIEVFYNATTSKTAYALIVDGQRIFGKDNVKIGWHVHPWDRPAAHESCEPVTFAEFLAEVSARP